MNDGYAAPSSRNVWRSTGFWLALLMGLLQALYALLAVADPGAFASYRGTPLAPDGGAGWVYTYASRTLFIAMMVGFLLARRELATLRWFALLGLVMPASDALISYDAGASTLVVARHGATVIFLLTTFIALGRWRRLRPA